ncbi:LuxR C-terminal-related transcriptional regulator [Actinosynnema sp. NPDC047251]|uniref:LuxR C-terminal-related transcriptional regulator n=1 Tax=Saccharothrix espanaensis TaxID=103731 RepID=UPI00059C8A71|nr:LuxR C-terminal-related transcriptional regulator [Saccharothrix espanaensis]
MFTGCAAAERLFDEVAADPDAERVVAVSGPGGFGKTAALAVLSGLFETTGSGGRAVVLVDDAHELPDCEWDRLVRLADDDGTRLVVAHRPWSGIDAARALPWTQPPVRLEPLDRAAVARRIAALLDAEPADELVDRVWAQTGGMPALVVPVAEAALAGRPVAGHAADRAVHEFERAPAAVRDVLLVAALGCPIEVDALAPVLRMESSQVEAATAGTWSTGLLTASGAVVGLVGEAILRQVPETRLRDLRTRVALVLLDRGESAVATAPLLVDAGTRGSRAAGVLEAAADELLLSDPRGAGEYYTAAVTAGAAPARLGARRAEAAALSGDLDTALRLAEEVLERPDGQARALAATVAATALAHKGMLAQSASLYQWAEPSVSAVLPLIGVGRLAEATRLVAGADPRPTISGTIRSLTAQGVLDSVIGSPVAALSHLLRADALVEPNGHGGLLPDTPAALAALVAMHLGEPEVATTVLDRAITGRGCADLVRHRLLRAWVALAAGDFAGAADGLKAATGGHRVADPRDELFAAAIEVGIARRLGENADLENAWPRARDAVMRHPVDLYVLQPVGEIAVAAARLDKDRWVEPHMSEAEALLERLGSPPLWAAPLHWYAVQAAIAAESPAKALHHATIVDGMVLAGTPAGAFAEATRCWLRVLGGDVEVRAVRHAALALREAGLVWDAARLAGQAAIRTPDRRSMSALLTCARSLREHDTDPPAEQSAQARTGPGGPALSDREVEVAELVVAGLTHKQIGERLFISAKTVEHHIARIRRRLGAGNRADLVAQLRIRLAQREN